MASRIESVDITPDTTLMPKMGRVGFTAPKALGELVDNSVDARIPGKPLHIGIEFNTRDKTIIVTDNAVGMTRDEVIKALTPAISGKSKDKIGQFGFGLKAACNYLARQFELVTTTADDKRAYRIVYNKDAFVNSRKWKLDLETTSKPFDHGTRIILSDLEISLYARLPDKVRDYIGRTFRFFIREADVSIIVDGTPVLPIDIPVQEKWEIDWTIQGKRVHGWVGIRRSVGDLKEADQGVEGDTVVGSERGLNGLTLARHNRVMRYGEWIGFQYHPTIRLLTGELHLDEFPVNVNKTDFLRDTSEWQELEEELGAFFRRIGLRKLLANESRRQQMADRKERAKIDRASEVVIGVATSPLVIDTALSEMQIASEHWGGSLDSQAVVRDVPAPLATDFQEITAGGVSPAMIPGLGDTRSAQTPTDVFGPIQQDNRPVPSLGELRRVIRGVRIEHRTATNGSDAPYKHRDFSELENRLTVTSNIDHPVYSAFADSTTWVYTNVAEGLAEHLTELAIRRDPEMGAMTIWRLFNRFKDEILRALGEGVIESPN